MAIAMSDTATVTSTEQKPQSIGSDQSDPVYTHMLESLASLRGCDTTAIHAVIQQGGGDCALDSHEGIHVIASLEKQLGRKLPGPADLQPSQYTSIKSLHSLIKRLT
jgi:hypothetical protein